jgi:hypothetical protein
MAAKLKVITAVPMQIGFRLRDRALAEKAVREAAKFGWSSHELARDVYEDFLTDARWQRLSAEQHQVRMELAKLRADLRESVVAVLCDAGKLEEVQARDWVAERLFR